MMFTIGPIFKVIEQLLAKLVIIIGKLPFGIGVGVFAMMWQPLVLTGTHVAVVTTIALPMSQIPAEPSAMYSALQIAIVGQIGATIAVLIRTKNQKLNKLVLQGYQELSLGLPNPWFMVSL
ncbi:PTS system beta-glucoside-specific IIABC component [Spiroplasma clarkii]|nr:PTS system beta-glucoside-specific IIABC component [Spiroplasma clarkii]